MAKYLVMASYTAEGAKGVLGEGGTKRRQAAEESVKSAGATIDALYFAFGDSDVIAIIDAPDHATVAAASMAINASGAIRLKTVVLLTPEEIDEAVKKGTTYRAPGQ